MPLIRQQHAEHMDQLAETSKRILPSLGYQKYQIDAFLGRNLDPQKDDFYRYEQSSDRAALIRVDPWGSQWSWTVRYAIPTSWHCRYEILQEAIGDLKRENRRRADSGMMLTIEEGVPSHTAYYAGMLPLLGFEMEAIVRFTAPRHLVDTLDLPELPCDVEEMPFTQDRLLEAADVLHSAYLEHYEHLSETDRKARKHSLLRELEASCQRQDTRETWTTLLHRGRIVASCFGNDDEWSRTLDIKHVGVSRTHRRRGLGRFICIRCMQKLRATCTHPDRRYFVSTYRTYADAMRLYSGLGFKLDREQEPLLTYAYWPPRRSE